MSVYFTSLIVVSSVSIVFGLQCYQCGQYNDGVGSITPCINYTHMVVTDCPMYEQIWCIKYVSEGTTIRDCVQKCTEKETWGTRTYCCREDGCNASSSTRQQLLVIFISICAVFLHRLANAH